MSTSRYVRVFIFSLLPAVLAFAAGRSGMFPVAIAAAVLCTFCAHKLEQELFAFDVLTAMVVQSLREQQGDK